MEDKDVIGIAADQEESTDMGLDMPGADGDAEDAALPAEAPDGGEEEETADPTGAEEETVVTSATEADGTAAEEAPRDEGDGAVPGEADTISDAPTDWSELCAAYPDVDPALVEQDATVGALLRGEVRPTPRQAYEITHLDAIVEARVAEQLAEQLADQVAQQLDRAVRESEARLLEHIRTCGQRPVENGVRAAVGVRMHPAVERLTRSDRAALAKRAQRGETIRL